MEIDINLVIQELVDEVADKVRQIAILRAQIKQIEANRSTGESSEHAVDEVSNTP